MSFFRDWPIRSRLALLTMGSTLLALLLASVGLLSYNQRVMRMAASWTSLMSELASIAKKNELKTPPPSVMTGGAGKMAANLWFRGRAGSMYAPHFIGRRQ